MRPRPPARSSGAARCAQKNCDFQIGIEDLVPLLFRGFGQRRGKEPGGAVYQDVQPAEALLDGANSALDLVVARQVG